MAAASSPTRGSRRGRRSLETSIAVSPRQRHPAAVGDHDVQVPVAVGVDALDEDDPPAACSRTSARRPGTRGGAAAAAAWRSPAAWRAASRWGSPRRAARAGSSSPRGPQDERRDDGEGDQAELEHPPRVWRGRPGPARGPGRRFAAHGLLRRGSDVLVDPEHVLRVVGGLDASRAGRSCRGSSPAPARRPRPSSCSRTRRPPSTGAAPRGSRCSSRGSRPRCRGQGRRRRTPRPSSRRGSSNAVSDGPTSWAAPSMG